MKPTPSKASAFVRGLFREPFDENPRVIDTPGANLTLEYGNKEWLDADRVAIVSSWAPSPVMSRSLSAYLETLATNGYVPFVISTSPCAGSLQWPHGLPEKSVVVRRDNIGYDFGSYSAALNAAPLLRNIDHLLLTNDSMVGPFGKPESVLTDVFKAAENSSADIFGLTESFQIIHHPQSFFLMFRQGVLNERPMREFFDGVRPQAEKVAVIQAYELGLSRHCAHQGYSWEAYANAYSVRAGDNNPTLNGWQGLLDAGIPMIKRNLLIDKEWSDVAREMVAEIQGRFGEDVRDWLPEGYHLSFETEPEKTKYLQKAKV